MVKEFHFNAKVAAWIDDDGKKKLVVHTTHEGSPSKVVISFGEFQSELLTREPELPCA